MQQRSQNPEGAKHHYIPVFYLKQWTGPDGRLCEFSQPYHLKDGAAPPKCILTRARRTVPDGTGYIRGLNTFSALPPELADVLETEFLQRADDGAAAALRRLLRCDVNLSEELRSAWSRFILTLLHRNAERMGWIAQRIVNEYPQRLAELRAAAGRSVEDIVLTEPHEQHLLLQMMYKVMDSQFLGTHLNRMFLMVINFEPNHPLLLTSDRPIVMTNGLNKPDSHLIMPISPRHIVVLANNQVTLKQFDEMARTGGMVRRINNRMARQARRYVYGVDDSELKFVAGRLGEKAAWSPLE